MKPIKLSENIKQKLIEEFTKSINNAKLSNDTLHFSAKITDTLSRTTPKTTVYVSAEAYLKMMLYVRDTATEIAWHGTVQRDKEKNYFYISDVFLYPQQLSAATVQTDQEKYNEWIMSLDDDTHNSMRFQGHSHVNFAASPSGTDLAFYDDMLQVLPENDFYIFMILNKRGEMTLLIYDLETNTIYETEDINFYIITDNDYDTIRTIEESKKKFCTVGYLSNKSNYTSYSSDNYQTRLERFRKEQDEILGKSDPDSDYLMEQDEPNDTDSLFADIDKKWKNATLKSTKKRRKK